MSTAAAPPEISAPAPTRTPALAPAPESALDATVADATGDHPVLEVHRSALPDTLSVNASGKIKMVRSFTTEPDDIGFGQVPAERVEKLHDLLRKVGFCTLAPKHREMSPGYTVIEAHFSDVACEVELPDARWDKDPRAKKVIDAVRTLEGEGCPTGCKP